ETFAVFSRFLICAPVFLTTFLWPYRYETCRICSPKAYKQIPKSPKVQIENGEEKNRKSRLVVQIQTYLAG
ncbi:hypothetical protein R3P38DRAFT_2990976, partial [Favolaschia claudopus]